MGRMRFLDITVACWALLLAPTLCAGGLLHHACANHDHEPTGCPHESHCATDPCGVVTIRIEDAHDVDGIPPALDGLAVAPTAVAGNLFRPTAPHPCDPDPPIAMVGFAPVRTIVLLI